MAIKCDEYNRVCVITPTADLSGEEPEAARRVVESMMEKKDLVSFVVDCERVDFVDSAGLESLLTLKRRAESLQGQLKLANVGENCRRILQATRLLNRFECHADLPAALRTMR